MEKGTPVKKMHSHWTTKKGSIKVTSYIHIKYDREVPDENNKERGNHKSFIITIGSTH